MATISFTERMAMMEAHQDSLEGLLKLPIQDS